MVLQVNMKESEEKVAAPLIQALLAAMKVQGLSVTLNLETERNGFTDLGKVEGESCSCGGALHLVRHSYGPYDFKCERC